MIERVIILLKFLRDLVCAFFAPRRAAIEIAATRKSDANAYRYQISSLTKELNLAQSKEQTATMNATDWKNACERARAQANEERQKVEVLQNDLAVARLNIDRLTGIIHKDMQRTAVEAMEAAIRAGNGVPYDDLRRAIADISPSANGPGGYALPAESLES